MVAGGFKRLPSALRPRNYRIHLQPDLRALTFSGDVVCELQVEDVCETIVCNSADLQVSSASYRVLNSESVEPADPAEPAEKWRELTVVLDAERELISCQLADKLVQGQRVLFRAGFTGVLTDKMCGFYRCQYTSSGGEERYAAATQFEASDARRCFPCWDEPAMKATFDIIMTVPRDRTALSNMPVIRTEDHASDSNLHVVYFGQSPVMSTYLVACVVGEFDSLHMRSVDGVDISVYTPLNKSEQGRFSLECCAKILPYYKEYFGIAYPLPKLDLVAIPDFAQGAMENWGLVTFRETCLLVDPVNTSTMRRQWCAQIVGHELAHMWFGNLVTMEWWTDLWLNEGYAEFMMFLSTDFLFPQYKIWQQFISECYVGALKADSLRTSHPIQVPVNDPYEIEEIFDSISYNKGASIIRMLHDYLGHEDFRRGMRLYLSRHQFTNTTTDQLWRALEETSGLPVASVMSTWTLQMGFPVVHVRREVSGADLVLTLGQRRYLADGGADECEYSWMVPLSFGSSDKPGDVLHKHLMTKMEDTVTLADAAAHSWVKLNIGAVGFYRVKYPDEMMDQFKPAVINQTMPTLDRNALLDDLFALVQSGDVSTVQFLRVAQWYRGETDFIIWSTLLGCMRRLHSLLQTCDEQSVRKPFWAFCRHLASGILAKLGWHSQPGEDHMTTLLRPMLIAHMVSFDDEGVLQEASRMLRQYLAGERQVHPDLRSSIYQSALKLGGRQEFQMLVQMHKEAELHEEKNRIANSLASAPTEEILSDVLRFSLSDQVRAQGTVFILIACSSNRLGRDLTWQFYRDNFQLIRERYKGRLLAILVKSITEDFCSEERAVEVEKFFAENPHPSSERSIRQALETIRLNKAWLERDESSLQQFLAETRDA